MELGVHEFTSRLDQLVAVYAAAMRPPTELLAGRQPIMAVHTSYPGFYALVGTVNGQLAGFCYGFHGVTGQWWHDRVRSGLMAKLGPEDADAWLEDTFEVAELHVLPDYQGRGIGSDLLHRVTTGRPERTAVLSTHDTESVARRLYRNVGFTDLLTGYRFDGSDPPYAVMGAELPLRDAAVSRPRVANPRS